MSEEKRWFEVQVDAAMTFTVQAGSQDEAERKAAERATLATARDLEHVEVIGVLSEEVD